LYNLLGRAIHAHFAQDSKDGHLISDNAADTGSLTPKYCHITFTSTQEVLVNGCHPTMVKPYFLASGITAVDLPSGPHLVGQHEVPLIPNSLIRLISETQAHCFGVDIDSKSRWFGGRGSILFDDTFSIPLQLEQALMTCPIRMPTQDELDTLHDNWLTNDAPWDSNYISEPTDDTLPVPLGYSNTLGEVNLLDLDISLSDLGEVTKDSMETDKAM